MNEADIAAGKAPVTTAEFPPAASSIQAPSIDGGLVVVQLRASPAGGRSAPRRSHVSLGGSAPLASSLPSRVMHSRNRARMSSSTTPSSATTCAVATRSPSVAVGTSIASMETFSAGVPTRASSQDVGRVARGNEEAVGTPRAPRGG